MKVIIRETKTGAYTIEIPIMEHKLNLSQEKVANWVAVQKLKSSISINIIEVIQLCKSAHQNPLMSFEEWKSKQQLLKLETEWEVDVDENGVISDLNKSKVNSITVENSPYEKAAIMMEEKEKTITEGKMLNSIYNFTYENGRI